VAGRNVERASFLLRDLSPRQQARLHATINDATALNEPAVRAPEIAKSLDEVRAHQAREQTPEPCVETGKVTLTAA
jgi:hypothetical protein